MNNNYYYLNKLLAKKQTYILNKNSKFVEKISSDRLKYDNNGPKKDNNRSKVYIFL